MKRPLLALGGAIGVPCEMRAARMVASRFDVAGQATGCCEARRMRRREEHLLCVECGFANVGRSDNRDIAEPKISGGGRSAHADLL